MNEAVILTPERILEVTEDVLRRYGLAKATVVDVARALDVSHGSVYRHFPSKASLREAVAKRWLDRIDAPLRQLAEEQGPAPARLDRWLRTLFAAKRSRVLDDPEMFETYLTLAREACAAVKCHKDTMIDQIAAILTDGVKQGVFEVGDVKATARAIFDATVRFHHPAHADEWKDADLLGACRCDARAVAARVEGVGRIPPRRSIAGHGRRLLSVDLVGESTIAERTRMVGLFPRAKSVTCQWHDRRAFRIRIDFNFDEVLRPLSKAVECKLLFEHGAVELNRCCVRQATEFIDELADSDEREDRRTASRIALLMAELLHSCY